MEWNNNMKCYYYDPLSYFIHVQQERRSHTQKHIVKRKEYINRVAYFSVRWLVGWGIKYPKK